jgi:hypothetical protein
MLNYLSELSSSVQSGGETDNVLNVEDAILKSRYIASMSYKSFNPFAGRWCIYVVCSDLILITLFN